MSNKPIEVFRAGNTEVAIWENQSEDQKTFHSVTAKRTYVDANGQWRDTGIVHLMPQQIPDLVLALQKSHEFLRMGLRQHRKSPAPEPTPAQPRQPESAQPSAAEDPGPGTSKTAGEQETLPSPEGGKNSTTQAEPELFTAKVKHGRGARAR